MNSIYGPDTVTVNYVQFWFRQFRSGMTVVENVHKVTEMIEVDRHVSSRSITQEIKIDHKTVLNLLHKDSSKKKLHVWGETN
ncbi:histone-lysine N-methyltransferase SETMAR [Trichonephila clavipes]|nr:histone-lysine N-methyltransferase SETMAR [Trichonephila clavipes]